MSLNYHGRAPARASKIINEVFTSSSCSSDLCNCSPFCVEYSLLTSKCVQCIGLRELNINLNDRTLCSIPYSAAAGFDLVRLYDMKDLLKFRDIVKLEIIATESLKQQFSEIGMDPFEAALQVLKQPRKPAQLKRQEKKDYPSQKATRATFGKTNFTTRMDKTQSRPEGLFQRLLLECSLFNIGLRNSHFLHS